MQKARGTIIRLTKLTESSRIVHWMTLECGLLKTVVKGARRQNSPFAGRLDLFFDAEIEWKKGRFSDLHFLREVAVIDFRESIRSSYIQTMVAGYFSQLLEVVLEPEHAELAVFDLYVRGLKYLEGKQIQRKGLFHFERELARILGLGEGGFRSLLQVYGKMPPTRDLCLDLLP